MTGGKQDGFEYLRKSMVDRLREQGIKDERVLDAMNLVPRHLFVPDALRSQSYRDNALPISAGQTISQPFIVAKMTELLRLTGLEKVLEVGSGTGYQTAILARLAKRVYSIERIAGHVAEADQRLDSLQIRNVVLKCSDGTLGLAESAPFDAILVAAGGPEVPQPLIDQLAVGGRLVVPIGDGKSQELVLVERAAAGYTQNNVGSCSFVPLIGEHGWQS